MTAPDHLRITGPEDILGFIPHSLGYWPVNSLVAMTMQGTRLGATLRVDLPEPSRCRDSALAAFARNVRGYLEADDEADGTLVAIFTGPPADGDGAAGAADAAGAAGAAGTDNDGAGSATGRLGPPALARLLDALERVLEEVGLPVRDAWLVDGRYWRNAHCSDPCCAPPGRPIEEIRNSRLNAELIFRGSSVGAAPGTATPYPPPAQCLPGALQAEAEWMQEFSGRWRDRAQFDAVLDVWERVLDVAARPASPRPARSRPAEPHPADPHPADPHPVDPHPARSHPAERHPADRASAGRTAAGRASARRAAAGRTGAGRAGAGRPTAGHTGAGRAAEERSSSAGPAAAATPGPAVPAGDPGALPAGLAGYLRATLCVAAWRDAVLVMAAAGRRAAQAGAEDFGMLDGGAGKAAPLPGLDGFPASSAGPARLPAAFVRSVATHETATVPGYGDVLLGLEPPVPDWPRLTGLDRVLLRLGDCGAGEARAAALTGRGWIEWCRGRGSYADALFTAAAEEQPGYRLAELLGELGRRGTLCGWARRKDSAWQKFDPDAA